MVVVVGARGERAAGAKNSRASAERKGKGRERERL